jgi:radical SAM protein with 4Fe4S-binding SPASM domain
MPHPATPSGPCPPLVEPPEPAFEPRLDGTLIAHTGSTTPSVVLRCATKPTAVAWTSGVSSVVTLADPAPSPVTPGPSELQLEVTGSCNLSCQMCLVAYRPRLGRSASLSLATVRRLLDDLPSVRRLTLQGLGEPLMAPDLDAIIAEAVGRGISVGFNTNATLLTRERSDALVAAGVDWVHVSIDGAQPATFATIRRGAHLETVVSNLRGLVAARTAAGRAAPWIQLNVVLMRANRAELAALVRLAADVGVDRVWVQGLSHDFSDVAADEGFLQIRRWTSRQQLTDAELAAAVREAAALAADLGVDARWPGGAEAPRRAGEPACDWPWRSAYVNHDGTVQPCCMLMGRQRGVMGNVADGPLSELWRGRAYTELREELLSDEPPQMCHGCAVYRRRF